MRLFYSVDIPVSFVTQFSANVHLLAEQKVSRLLPCVMREDIQGESWAVETLGGIDAPNQVTVRHGDTPLNSTPHARRWGFVKDYDVADLIDRPDRAKLLINPDSLYTMRHAGTMGRGMDDAIIDALFASATSGHGGTGGSTTTVAFPTSTQQIASGSTGLTIDKLNRAKEILDANEVDEFYPRYFAGTARQIRELLEDDKVTSQDFNTVKALVRGELDEFLGFRFVRTERLVATSSVRNCFAWAQPGIRFGMNQSPSSVANIRPDKRNAVQIYTSGSWGAIRVEDKMVVSVLCSEA